MKKIDELKPWYIYVLKYKSTGNYYVGVTPNLWKRMLIHWRRISYKNNLPKWSFLNRSRLGFKFFWFKCDSHILSQSEADRLENEISFLILSFIEPLNKKSNQFDAHVGNSNLKDGKVHDIHNVLQCRILDQKLNDMIDLKIKELTSVNNYKLRCTMIGSFKPFNSKKSHNPYINSSISYCPLLLRDKSFETYKSLSMRSHDIKL